MAAPHVAGVAALQAGLGSVRLVRRDPDGSWGLRVRHRGRVGRPLHGVEGAVFPGHGYTV